MRLIGRTLVCLTLLLALAVPAAIAQTSSATSDQRIYEVKTKDGGRY